ncbi:magnesium transporter CorA family protein [Enterococcus faecalis]
MPKYYFIGGERVRETEEKDFNWLVIDTSETQVIERIIKEYNFPKDIFVGTSYPEEVSRFETLSGTTLKQPISLVLMNLFREGENIEERLAPISFISSENLLITCTNENNHFFDRLLEKYGCKIDTFEKLITYAILDIYSHYVEELKEKKQRIDRLDKKARMTTENKELYRQADLEREIVYIDHTLKDQKSTLELLWQSSQFVHRLSDKKLLYDVQLRQRQTEKMISIYRDLLESIGNLFSGMMDNQLNHLMKYLDSAALIISIPAMIAGVWGMNTGGLPGKSSGLGFLLVVLGALIISVAFGYHLYKKDYSK